MTDELIKRLRLGVSITRDRNLNPEFIEIAEKCAAALEAQAKEIERLKAENQNLCTVMMAAAVEITEHWDSHCDAEGYGPANLVRRLENGYPEQYGYDAKTVVRLEQQRDALQAKLDAAQAQEPVKFLAKGARFKTSEFPYGVCINGLPKELAGRWVALVAAEDACHLKLASPVVQQPLTDEQLTQMRLDARESNKVTLEHWWILFARAVEAAHGIGGQQP